MSTTTAFSAGSSLLNQQESHIDCACNNEEHDKSSIFRGIFVAIPAGLGLWVCLLKLATVIVHHI